MRDADGKELVRKDVSTNSVVAINNWGHNHFTVQPVGAFQGPSTSGRGLQFINGTGKVLHHQIENADFSVTKGKSRDPKTSHAFELVALHSMGNPGSVVKTSLSVAGIDPKGFDITVSSLYLVTEKDGALVLEKLHGEKGPTEDR